MGVVWGVGWCGGGVGVGVMVVGMPSGSLP